MPMGKFSYRNLHTSNNKYILSVRLPRNEWLRKHAKVRMTTLRELLARHGAWWGQSTLWRVTCGGRWDGITLATSTGIPFSRNRDVTYVCIPNNVFNTLPAQMRIKFKCNTFIHMRISDIFSDLCPASSTQLCLCSLANVIALYDS